MLALWIAPFTWAAARSVAWRPKAGLRVRGAALTRRSLTRGVRDVRP